MFVEHASVDDFRCRPWLFPEIRLVNALWWLRWRYIQVLCWNTLTFFQLKYVNLNVANFKIISPSAKKNESLPLLYFYHQLAYLSAKANHQLDCSICRNLLLKWQHNTLMKNALHTSVKLLGILIKVNHSISRAIMSHFTFLRKEKWC